MSFMRSAIPVVLAVGFGIFNAQYVLKPLLEQEAQKRDQQTIEKGGPQSAAAAPAAPAPAPSAEAPESQTPATKS
ncbi:hypothetical protein KJ359_000750 [Pestalotiopsis sp. 9143b]|nr:hypothetical protein KJ359_000750 [Pestalotiopsis sp. 9143b]